MHIVTSSFDFSDPGPWELISIDLVRVAYAQATVQEVGEARVLGVLSSWIADNAIDVVDYGIHV